MHRTPLLTEDFLLWQRELTELPTSSVVLWGTRWELAALTVSWLVGAGMLGVAIWLLLAVLEVG